MTNIAPMSSLPYEAECLADDLTQGNPAFGWKGDPRLSLVVGVLCAAKGGYRKGRYYKEGEVLARRYEVRRHNEDGTDATIITKTLDKLHEILPALVQMDPRTPGHVGTMDRIEKHNAKVDADKESAIGEALGEMHEHLWHLVADRQNGKTTFRGMPGSNPDRQM